MTPEERAEELRRAITREAQVIARYRKGATFDEIGAEFGVTRERARQLLRRGEKRRGLEPTVRPFGRRIQLARARAIERVARRKGVRCLADATRASGHSRDTVVRALELLGRRAAIERLWTKRRGGKTMQEVLRAEQQWTGDELRAVLRRIAREKGRTPTLRDINEHKGGPSHPVFYSAFGSLPGSHIAAGLVPTFKGQRAHVYRDGEVPE